MALLSTVVIEFVFRRGNSNFKNESNIQFQIQINSTQFMDLGIEKRKFTFRQQILGMNHAFWISQKLAIIAHSFERRFLIF